MTTNLIPNTSVEGTDGHLVTGLLYTIKHVESGLVVSYQNGVPKEKKSAEKPLSAGTLEDYGPGGELQSAAQFYIQSAGNPYYVIHHKDTKSVMTYIPKKLTATNHDQLVVSDSSKYKPTGDWSNSTNFALCKESGHYALFNKELNGYVTCITNQSGPTIRREFVIQNGVDVVNGSKINKSALFTFMPPCDYKLCCEIKSFVYEDSWRKQVTSDPKTLNKSYLKNDSDHEQKRSYKDIRISSWKNTWTFKETSLTGVERCDHLSVDFMPPEGIGAFGFAYRESFDESHIVNNGKTLSHSKSGRTTNEVSKDVTIPAGRKVKVKHVEQSETRTIKFTAKAYFTAYSNRVKTNGVVLPQTMLDADAVKSLLRSYGHKVVEKVGAHKAYVTVKGTFQVDITNQLCKTQESHM